MKSILDVAKVVRSKNAGPFELTLDIIFKTPADYAAAKERKLIDAGLIARLYHIPEAEVKKVIYFDPALAVKILMVRRTVSGSPGDTDVYGAQQHGPLLGMELDL